jgi:hypothetical protein
MTAISYLLTVQMQFAVGIWIDVSADVMRPLSWQRGIAGNGPKDNVAGTGTFSLILRNDETNSAETLGLYSPNHPDCQPGFGEGTPVRLLVTSGSIIEKPVWTGKLYTILPDTGVYGNRRTVCVAQDCMGDLADTDVLEVGRQIAQTEVEVLNAVLDSLPADSQPVARDFDPALSEFPVALDDISGGERAWGVCEKVVTSARGSLYPLGDGTLKYQNLERRFLEVSQYTFTDDVLQGIEVPSSRANVFNRVKVTTHPRTFFPLGSPAEMVLASHEGALAIEAGATEEIFLSYQDPDRPELKIGGTDFVDPVEATTDFLFNDAADGGGADVTGDMIVVADFFPADVKLTITNTGSVTAYRQLLQVRGRGIYDLNPVTRRAYTPMAYGTREVEIDLPYQDDDAFAQAVADFLEASYRELADQVNGLTFYPQDRADLMEQALTREIGEVVDGSETVALPNGVSNYIQSIAGTETEAGQLIWHFGLAPRIVTEESQDDTVWIHDHLGALAVAPETRIGFMVIGFSEIG